MAKNEFPFMSMDLTKMMNGDWTDFTGYLCRGVDDCGHFRHLDAPKAFGRNPRNEYR